MAGGLALLAGCSGGDDNSVADPLAPPSSQSSTSSASTTASSAAASASTTASSTTAPVETQLEAEVLAAHEEFMVGFFARDDRELTLEERISRAAEIAVDPVLGRLSESLAEQERNGEYMVSPGYESNVVSVEINGDTASVLDCSLDRGFLYDRNDEVIVGADEEHRLRRSDLVLIDRSWFVADLFTGGDVCVPGE